MDRRGQIFAFFYTDSQGRAFPLLFPSSVCFNILEPSLEEPRKLKCIKNKVIACPKAKGDALSTAAGKGFCWTAEVKVTKLSRTLKINHD